MKRLTLLSAFALLLISASFAVDSTRFYAKPSVNFVPKTGQTAVVLGMETAYSPIHRFFIGVTYRHVMNQFMPLTETDTRKELTSSWGGIKLNYQIANQETFKVYTHLTGGRGLLDIIIDEDGALPDEQEWYSFAQAGINFDMPVHPSLNITIGLDYRFVSEIQYKNVTAQDISGLSGQIGLRYVLQKR